MDSRVEAPEPAPAPELEEAAEDEGRRLEADRGRVRRLRAARRTMRRVSSTENRPCTAPPINSWLWEDTLEWVCLLLARVTLVLPPPPAATTASSHWELATGALLLQPMPPSLTRGHSCTKGEGKLCEGQASIKTTVALACRAGQTLLGRTGDAAEGVR